MGPDGMRGVKVKNQPHLRIPKSHWNPDMSLSDVKAFRATKSKVRVMEAGEAFRHRDHINSNPVKLLLLSRFLQYQIL
jgi:hypothetical protein